MDCENECSCPNGFTEMRSTGPSYCCCDKCGSSPCQGDLGPQAECSDCEVQVSPNVTVTTSGCKKTTIRDCDDVCGKSGCTIKRFNVKHFNFMNLRISTSTLGSQYRFVVRNDVEIIGSTVNRCSHIHDPFGLIHSRSVTRNNLKLPLVSCRIAIKGVFNFEYLTLNKRKEPSPCKF